MSLRLLSLTAQLLCGGSSRDVPYEKEVVAGSNLCFVVLEIAFNGGFFLMCQ